MENDCVVTTCVERKVWKDAKTKRRQTRFAAHMGCGYSKYSIFYETTPLASIVDCRADLTKKISTRSTNPLLGCWQYTAGYMPIVYRKDGACAHLPYNSDGLATPIVCMLPCSESTRLSQLECGRCCDYA